MYHLGIAASNGAAWTNAAAGDLLLYAAASNRRVLLGVPGPSNAALTLSGAGAWVSGPLALSNATGSASLASSACNLQVAASGLAPSADLSTALGTASARWASVTAASASLINSANANAVLSLGTPSNPAVAQLFAVNSNAAGFDQALVGDVGLKAFQNGRLHLGVGTSAAQPTAICIGSNNLVGLNNTAPQYGLDLAGNLRAGPPPLASGLLAYYPLDGNSQDATGNGYGLTGTGSVTYGPGQLGTAIYYNNPVNATGYATSYSDSLVVGNTVAVSPPLSVAAWFYASTYVATGSWQPTFFAFGGGTLATQALAVSLNLSNNLVMYLATAGTSPGSFATGGTVPIGTWNHVCVTYDGSNVTGYLNGTPYGSPAAATGALKYAGRFRLGDGFAVSANATGWNGAVDDVRVYGRALAASDVASLYNGSPGPVAVAALGAAAYPGAAQPSLASNLTAYYQFEQSLADSSGNNYALSNTGSPTYSNTGSPLISASNLGYCIQYANASNTSSTYATQYTQNATLGGSTGTAAPLTVTTWFNTTTSVTSAAWQPYVFTLGGPGSNCGLSLNLNINNTYIVGYNTSNAMNYFSQQPAVTVNAWHHFGLTYDGSNLGLYLDGSQLQQVPLTGALRTGAPGLRIGDGGTTSNTGGNTTGWNGSVDDFRIYGRALTPQDMASLYNKAAPQGTTPYAALDLTGAARLTGNLCLYQPPGRANPESAVKIQAARAPTAQIGTAQAGIIFGATDAGAAAGTAQKGAMWYQEGGITLRERTRTTEARSYGFGRRATASGRGTMRLSCTRETRRATTAQTL